MARLLERYRDQYESIELKYKEHQSIELKSEGKDPKAADLPLTADLRSSIEALFSVPGLPPVQVLPGGNGARAWYYYTDSLRIIRAIQFLSRFEGEKHLVFVSERPLPDGLSESRHAKLAAATRVALWLMQTGGVQSGTRPPINTVLIGQDSRAASEQSGGFASVHENPAALLARLDRMTSRQYLLGYYPSSPPAENAFGSIRVVVNRPDVTVLHRHSYLPKTQFDEADLRRFFLEARVEQALSWLRKPPPPTTPVARSPSIRVSALVTPTTAGEVQISVELAFDPSILIFTQQGNALLARRDLVLVVDGADQETLARSTDRLEIRYDAREYARRSPKWPGHQLAITVKGNPAHVRAVLYDYDTDNTLYGTVRVRR